MSTVGYGDIYCYTYLGRLFNIAFISVGLVSTCTIPKFMSLQCQGGFHRFICVFYYGYLDFKNSTMCVVLFSGSIYIILASYSRIFGVTHQVRSSLQTDSWQKVRVNTQSFCHFSSCLFAA